MNVTSKITVDMTRQNVGQRVNSVQGDGNTRLVEITLLSGGQPWSPPEGVEAAIAYMQPGGTKGLYNKLADGTAAISISGNVATVILATQMLAASGTVRASLVFNDAQLNRLTTFPFEVSVTSNPAAGAQKTEDYIRLQWLEDKLDEYLRKAADSGAFDGKPGDNGVTFTPSVSENGDLSWRNNGGLPNPQTVNIRGPKGDSTAATALRFGDPYDGVDLTAKFAGEIAGYSDPGAWIRSRIRANNFDGIHVNDYIPFTTTNGLNFKARILGIDPYYEYSDYSVGHHIDWACEELWPTLHPINPVNYNNGLIPTENVTSDGTATQYVLTKPMYGVAKVTLSGTDLTGWTYDKDTYTLTFSTAPAAGTMVVTGIGSEYPWLSCDAYLYANSLAGHVPNGTGVNPAIKRVDYTNDGIYHYLPDWLKSVIIDKRVLLGKRYSTSGVLSNENGFGWVNLGKLWFPAEMEVYGCPVWGNKDHGVSGFIQYPYFVSNTRRVKKRNGSRYYWWLLSPHIGTANWCCVGNNNVATFYGASYTNGAAPVCFRIG